MCPSGDSGYHLYYNPDKSVFFCHKCHYSGHGFPKLVNTSVPLVATPKVVKAKDLEWLPLRWPPQGILESAVWDYLIVTRGLTINAIQYFKLGWTHKIPLAVVIPLVQGNETRALQVRFLSNLMKPKYLNYAIGEQSMEKSEMIYNFDTVINGVETLYIMEGVFDVMKAAMVDGIGTFGKNISVAQLLLINKIPRKKLVLSYDYDVKIKDMIGSIKILESFSDVFIKKMPVGMDPGDYDTVEFKLIPEITSHEFMLEALQ